MVGIEFIRDLAVVLLVAGGVGWLCQRAGLSLVVGYLAAGAIIGPYTPPFQLVADGDRVQMLSQVGLVFLIFSIGLDLGLQRLRRLGFPILVATFIGAILVFHACRFFGVAMGWTQTESLFLAAMLMVSSSAILSKILHELNATHEVSGQLALGVTVFEDLVAVVMLTILSTFIQFEGEEARALAPTIGKLVAFVAVLLFVSLLFVPRLLVGLTRTGSNEVRTVLVGGLLLILAWLAASAGYSLALGAFLLGVIISNTPQRPEIERVFEGLRDMFGAVFFVAMGMLVEFQLLADVWLLAIGVAVFTIVCRAAATSIGLVLSGRPARDSMRAGMALTPLGEFSFVMAQLGVLAGVVPRSFYPMAVGASLITTFLAPLLIRRSLVISVKIEQRFPLFLREWINFYHAWLQKIEQLQERNILWKLTAPRLLQTGMQMLLVSALILVARPVYQTLHQRIGQDWLFPNGFNILFWTLFGLFLLAPLVAIWRNLDAIIMIFADSVTARSLRKQHLRPLIEVLLKSVSSAVLLIWLLALMPFGLSVLWAFLVVITLLGVFALLFWRRLVYLHSRLEIELRTQIQGALGASTATPLAALLEKQPSEWNLEAEEFVLPTSSEAAGRRISELALRKRFGCSIVSIERRGIVIINPPASTGLYPDDKLLLLGTPEQIAEAVGELSAMRPSQAGQQPLEEFTLDTIVVPQDSPRAGKQLIELDAIRQFGIQVAGIRNAQKRIVSPTGSDRVEAGDELLVLGTPGQIREFKSWIHPAV